MALGDEVLQIMQRHARGVKVAGPNEVKAICPFHIKADGQQERNPSFYMNTATGLWICHACHEAGGLRAFLRNVGVSHTIIEGQYGDLIEEAERATPNRFDPANPGVYSNSPLPENLLGIFDYCPLDLVAKGFKEETLRSFDVGFDKHHMRITYPLRDLGGQLIGISGRSTEGFGGRYKLYDNEYAVWGLPRRDLSTFQKGAVLWNAHRVLPLTAHIRDARIVLVEGFKGCMWIAQAGIKTTVAMLGSFMTQEQKWILEQFGGTVYVMTDNDKAGQTARGFIGAELSKSLDTRIVVYGDSTRKTQPDTLSSIEVVKAIETAPTYVEWKHKLR